MALSDDAMRALRSRRFLLGAWPWRGVAFTATSVVAVAAVSAVVAFAGLPWLIAWRMHQQGGLSWGAGVGLGALGVVLVAGVGSPLAALAAGVEHGRIRWFGGRRGPATRRHWAVGAPRSWRHRPRMLVRDVAYLLVVLASGPLVYLPLMIVALLTVVLLVAPALIGVAEPISLGPIMVETATGAWAASAVGLAAAVATPYLWTLAAAGHVEVAAALLASRDEEVTRHLVEVTRSRARLVQGFDLERRRIERDLHDGAQQRLVGLTMTLGLARSAMPDGDPAKPDVVRAHDQAKLMMGELRAFIHGIHPAVLSDRGLVAAMEELADSSPVPLDVRAHLKRRPPEHIETTAYFSVAEAVANIAKHSAANRATIRVHNEADRLVVQVVDDGQGGADPAAGSGLTGIADRLSVLDGTMTLASPPGGPTSIRMEIPWPTLP